eukprot:COSAG02_NODE_48598_length_332_cov_1.227468_1_plen_87_part_01
MPVLAALSSVQFEVWGRTFSLRVLRLYMDKGSSPELDLYEHSGPAAADAKPVGVSEVDWLSGNAACCHLEDYRDGELKRNGGPDRSG